MLYIGIDIGKSSHCAAFLSSDLLRKHHDYEHCPTLTFLQTREGFHKLTSVANRYGPPQETCVLVERTGHYGYPLEQYLHECGFTVYRVHVQERPKGSKSDKRDAQALAVLLYNQLERGVLMTEKEKIARPVSVPSDAARYLNGLVQHRVELIRERVRRKNKLTAIMDELFPEFKDTYHDVNSPSALLLRERYPAPRDILVASLDDLCATRKRNQPARAKLAEMQDAARHTIGTKGTHRIKSLSLETQQLIAELRLHDQHIEALDAEITQTVMESREGQILCSIPPIGPIQAAYIISAIGSIGDFESAAKLKAYCGWCPRQNQTGTTMDSMTLSQQGNRMLKSTLYLLATAAVRTKQQTQWKILYDRLVPLKCSYDERLKRYRGRMKVIGRIAGQMITVIYTLLRRDYDLLTSLPQGKELPPPELYDVAKHTIRQH